MANNLINPADQPIYEAGALAERNRIRGELRKIAARFEGSNHMDAKLQELTIRRVIEEIFDGPIPPDEPQSTGRGVRK